MKETRVAQRYAKSLISLAEERQVLEQVKEDMVIIKSVCEENRDFNNMLKSPVVKTDKKSAILKEIFAKELSELSLAFLNIITKKKREAALGAIANNFIHLYNESKNSPMLQLHSQSKQEFVIIPQQVFYCNQKLRNFGTFIREYFRLKPVSSTDNTTHKQPYLIFVIFFTHAF